MYDGSSILKIPQDDVDRLALYLEIIEDMSFEPFYSKDEKMSLSGATEEREFYMGDRAHFRSALISFRRLWMNDEPSNYKRVAKIVDRYRPGTKGSHISQIDRNLYKDGLIFGPSDMTRKDLLELWINCVFAHSGQSSKKKLQRRDFDKAVEKYGIGILEWNFRNIVSWAGKEMIKMGFEYIQPFMDEVVALTGKRETFNRSSPFGRSIQEVTKSNDVIYRKASSKFHSDESAEHRFVRVLKRGEHHQMSSVIEKINVPPVEKLMSLLRSDDLEQFLRELGGALEIHEAHTKVMDLLNRKFSMGSSVLGDQYVIDRYRGLHVTQNNHQFFLLAYLRLKEDFLDTDDRAIKPPEA
jgi:hypothetical protein